MKKYLDSLFMPVLIAFVVVDLLLFGANNDYVQGLSALFFYLLVLLALFVDVNIGLMYFLSFNLLSIGIGNYEKVEMGYNYYGLRLGPVSFNIFFTFLLLLILLFIHKKSNKKLTLLKWELGYLLFVMVCAIMGLLNWLLGNIYFDNYLTDVMTFSPGIIYLYLLKWVAYDNRERILLNVAKASILMLFLSAMLSIKSSYAGVPFTVQNSLYFILPIMLIELRNDFSRMFNYFCVAFFAWMLLNNLYFVAGKSFILFVLYLVIRYRYVSRFIFGVMVYLVMFPVADLITIIYNTISRLTSNPLFLFKLEQALSVASFAEWEKLIKSYTSIGNLLAEFKTSVAHYAFHPIYMIFGKGFGGAIPDIFGYLSQFAGTSGYNAIDAIRDDFHKLHLPLTEIFVKLGTVGVLFYLQIIRNLKKEKTKYATLGSLMLLLVFYVSKEHLLLTFLLMSLIKFRTTKNLMVL